LRLQCCNAKRVINRTKMNNGMDSRTRLRLDALMKACAAARWELKSFLKDPAGIPADLLLVLQGMDGKAELAALLARDLMSGAPSVPCPPGHAAKSTPPSRGEVTDVG
jgi:hypothetical protein